MSAITAAILTAVAILSTATLINFFFLKKNPQNKTLNNVRVIVRSWWLIIGVFLVGMALGPYGVTGLFYIVTLVVYREYLKVTRLQHLKTVLMVVLSIALTCQYAVLVLGYDRLFYSLVPLMALWLIPAVVVANATVKDLDKMFATSFGLLLIGFYLSHVPAITLLLPMAKVDADFWVKALVFLVILTEGNDVFQFLSGKLFGRRKIVPEISPNKTEAGFLGGVLLTSLVAMFVVRPFLGLSYGQAATLGFIVACSGICGDLFFSAAKRHFEIKDFSDAIPGHGGVLDRLDSLILTAPVYFHLLLFFQENKI